MTLDAEGDPDAVWIFQMESTLITASDSSVVLVNGAQACNVFWQVGSSATLGTGADFQGNILAQASITMNNGATLEGRALARTGAVTLDNNVITIAECAPDDEPPGDEPPGDEPPGDEPPGDEPPGDEPPGDEPPGDQPPGDQPPGDEPVGCSTDLEASANEDTSIELTWKPVEGADQHRIYRADDCRDRPEGQALDAARVPIRGCRLTRRSIRRTPHRSLETRTRPSHRPHPTWKEGGQPHPRRQLTLLNQGPGRCTSASKSKGLDP